MEKEFLRRYFENRVSENEREIVASWLADPENEEAVLDYIESAYLLETGSAHVAPFDTMFEKAKKEKQPEAKVISILRRKWLWAASAACVLFLLLGGGLGYFLQTRALDEDALLLNTAHTGIGQYAQLTLSDGSEVYLGSDSKLSFPEKMDARQVVYLEGEAYFDLQDERSAVIVKTKDLVTTAKGSKFNIRAFLKDSTVTVTVETGKVEVRNSNETFPLLKLRFPKKDSIAGNENEAKAKIIPWMKLTPALTIKANEQATYDKKTKTTGISELEPGIMPLMKLRPAKVRSEGSQDELNFYKANINDIRNKIEQKYDVKMEINTNGNHLQSFTGEFGRDAGINEVLDRICNTLGLEYSIKDSSVIITLLK